MHNTLEYRVYDTHMHNIGNVSQGDHEANTHMNIQMFSSVNSIFWDAYALQGTLYV